MKNRVTTGALIKRLNNSLPDDGLMLLQCKANSHWYHELGDYYLIDTRLNAINSKCVDIEKLARGKSLLGACEELV